jgi:amyloid beta precursor protein binding protein 1
VVSFLLGFYTTSNDHAHHRYSINCRPLRTHIVIDTHPDHAYTLQIDRPFESLESYALGLNMDEMDSMEHSHVPYIVLLIRALRTFEVSDERRSYHPLRVLTAGRTRFASKKESGGSKPVYETMDSFKEVLFRERRAIDEENFTEAEGQAFAVTQVSEVRRCDLMRM